MSREWEGCASLMDGRPGGRVSGGVRGENKGRRTGGTESVGRIGRQKPIKEIKSACRKGRDVVGKMEKYMGGGQRGRDIQQKEMKEI